MKGKRGISKMISSANDGDYSQFKGFLEEAINKRFQTALDTSIGEVRSSLFQEGDDPVSKGVKGKKGSDGKTGLLKKGETKEDPGAKKGPTKKTLTDSYDKNGDWLYEEDDEEKEEETEEKDSDDEKDDSDDDDDDDDSDDEADDKAEAKLKEESYRAIQEINELKESIYLMELNGHLMESDSEDLMEELEEIEEAIKDNLRKLGSSLKKTAKGAGKELAARGRMARSKLGGKAAKSTDFKTANKGSNIRKKMIKDAGAKLGGLKKKIGGAAAKVADKANDMKVGAQVKADNATFDVRHAVKKKVKSAKAAVTSKIKKPAF